MCVCMWGTCGGQGFVPGVYLSYDQLDFLSHGLSLNLKLIS